MKSLLSICILISLLHVSVYPQKIKPDFGIPDSGLYFSEHKELLSPFKVQKLSNKALRKTLVDNESGDPVYRPVEVVIDSINRHICSYDNKGNLISAREETFMDGLWMMSYRTAYKYDSKDNLLVESLYKWSENYWKNYRRDIYTYDENGNRISYSSERLQDTNWVNSYREFYTYDSNGRLLSHNVQQFFNNNWVDFYRINWSYGDNSSSRIQENFKDGAWVKIRRVAKSFDSAGNELSYLEERWQRETWVKDYICVYTYDSRGNRTSEVSENWEYGIFHGRSRMTYTYDDTGSCISTLSESWQDSTFVKEWLITSTYDEAGNPLEFLTQHRAGNIWENAYRISYTYDSNGNAVKGESFRWHAVTWVSSSSEYFDLRYNKGVDHLDIVGGFVDVKYDLLPEEDSSPVREFSLFQNYPNPFNPSTSINYEIKRDGSVKLALYDVLGKLIAVVVDEYKSAGSYFVRFDGSRLPSGVYIYSLESGGYSIAKKFILMK